MKRLRIFTLLGVALLLSANADACRPYGSYTFVEDEKGGIWFTEGDNNAVSRLAPDGSVSSYPLPSPNAEPSSIAVGNKGNIWFIESDAMKIGHMGSDGKISEYPTNDGHPVLVAVDSNNEAWFTQMSGDHPVDSAHAHHAKKWISKIGRITTRGKMVDYPISEGWPTSIAIDNRNVVWVTILVRGDLAGGDGRPRGKLAQIDRGGRWNYVKQWDSSCPSTLTATPGGGLAFSDHCRGVLARVAPGGELTEVALPPDTTIQDMSSTPDGTLWFTSAEGGKIGRVSAKNEVVFVDRPENGDEAFAILATKSGDIIYSEFYNYNVNRLTKDGVFEEFLINVDQRHNMRKSKKGEVCEVRFGARIASKTVMDNQRAEEVKNGKFKPTPDGAEKLAEQKCLACHDTRRLLLSRRSDWSPSIERMQEYMRLRNVKPLSDEEKRILVSYFNTHYSIASENRVER